ncbi:hypothetical protein BHE74_00057480 [Ensete ventricosum]|nr:hypothetical protein BHE74_00057480 [Ensete ventricosum]
MLTLRTKSLASGGRSLFPRQECLIRDPKQILETIQRPGALAPWERGDATCNIDRCNRSVEDVHRLTSTDRGEAMVVRGKGKAARVMVAGLQREGADGADELGRWLQWWRGWE